MDVKRPKRPKSAGQKRRAINGDNSNGMSCAIAVPDNKVKKLAQRPDLRIKEGRMLKGAGV